MRKIIFTILLCVSGIAAAGPYVAAEYETSEDRNTKADSYSIAGIFGYKLQDNWQVSGKMQYSQAEWGQGNITESLEARVKKAFTYGSFKPYLGVRLGERLKSNDSFAYYAIDAGTKVSVVKSVDLDFSYRYRNSFDSGKNFQTDRYGIEGIYKINDSNSVGLRYAQTYGDSESNSWRFQYTHSF